jgi:hypothetical protein
MSLAALPGQLQLVLEVVDGCCLLRLPVALLVAPVRLCMSESNEYGAKK